MDPARSSESPVEIRELLWLARQYRWVLLLPVVVAVCGASIYLHLSSPLYESSVIVSVGVPPQVSAALEPLVRGDREDRGEKVAVVSNRVQSPAFLLEVANRAGLQPGPAQLARAKEAAGRLRGITPEELADRMTVTMLSAKIKVVPVQGRFVRISVTDPDPTRARALASTVTDVLIEQSRASSLERVRARGEFSADQIPVYRERLRKAEDALQQRREALLRRKLASNPINADNLEAARIEIEQADEEAAQVRDRFRAAAAEWRRISEGETLPELTSPRVVDLQGRLNELERGYGAAVLRTGRAGEAEAADLSGKIAAVRRSLLSEFQELSRSRPATPSPEAAEALAALSLDRAILKSLRQKRDHLSALLRDYSNRVESSPREELELQRLESEVQTNRDLLGTLGKEATASRLSEALETSSLGPRLDVVDSPQIPLTPVFPDVRKIYAMVLVFGPALSVGLVALWERFKGGIRSVKQAEEELGVKVIGTVPRVEGWSRPGSYLQRNWAALCILLVLLLTGALHTVRTTVSSRPSSNAPAVVPRP